MKKTKTACYLTALFLCLMYGIHTAALTLSLPEQNEEATDAGDPEAALSAGPTFLGYDFESGASQKEEIWGIGDGATYEYRDGMLVFTLDHPSGNVEFVPEGVPGGEKVSADNGRYLAVKVRNNSDCTKMQFWYQTEADSDWDGNSRAFTVPIASHNGQFVTYTVDLATWPNWRTSTFKTARLIFVGGTAGTIEIEEVYFTDTRPFGSERHLSPMTERFGLSADGSTGITASRTDNWASILTKNADGSFSFTGKTYFENYSVWVRPAVPVDSAKYKYFVMRVAKDFDTRDMVMILARSEGGSEDTWRVSNEHFTAKTVGNEKYLVFDLSNFTALNGNITLVQFYVRVWNGSLYDAYFSPDGATADTVVEKAKVYASDDRITVPLGRVSVNAVVRFADGHEAEEIEYAVDGDAAEIVTENGRTFLQAKENGSVTVTAFYDGGEIGKFNVTVSGQADVTPETAGFSTRADEVSGLRLGANVAAVVKTMDAPDVEYGFIASGKTVFDKLLLVDTDLSLSLPEEAVTVRGKAYEKVSGEVLTDLSVEEDEDAVFIRCVFTDFPETKEAFTESLIARPYVKIGEALYYGTPKTASLYETVKALPAKEIEENDYYQTVIAVSEAE